MKLKFIIIRRLYIFLAILALIKIFFSTVNAYAENFTIKNIEISKPFEINFNKNDIIDAGFKIGFSDLMEQILSSKDNEKIGNSDLGYVKSLIETFSIKEEEFIDQVYYLKLDVTFNKKKIFKFLQNKNIFPSIPNRKKIFFMPIIIDESKKNLLLYRENNFYNNWNKDIKKNHLIEYILPSEDLEDLKLIKNQFEFIENYDFQKIAKKYNLENYIIALIFKNYSETRILSKVGFDSKIILDNKTYKDINFNDTANLSKIIIDLKLIYEDFWKTKNQINTSIKLPLMIKISAFDEDKIKLFEESLEKLDLVNDFYIYKFDKDEIFYRLIFNGSPDKFIDKMKYSNLEFDIQNKIWILK